MVDCVHSSQNKNKKIKIKNKKKKKEKTLYVMAQKVNRKKFDDLP